MLHSYFTRLRDEGMRGLSAIQIKHYRGLKGTLSDTDKSRGLEIKPERPLSYTDNSLGSEIKDIPAFVIHR